MRTLWTWCLAHPEAALTAVVAFLLVLWKRVPAETRAAIEQRHPRLVNAVRVGYALFPDLVKAAAAARAVKTGTPKTPPDLPPVLDPAKGEILPRSSAPPLAVLLLAALSLGGGLHACSGTAIQRQAAVAHVTAQTANRALEVVVAEYDRAGSAALRAACCDRQAMRDALTTHRARWRPVIVAWDIARVAHDAWAIELEACRAGMDAGPDAGSCGPSLGQLASRALSTFTALRCALRAVGPDLDPIPGALACAAPDGGLR
jgi:hypothetical protein